MRGGVENDENKPLLVSLAEKQLTNHVCFFIDSGVDIDVDEQQNNWPHENALRVCRRVDLCEALLAAGANVNDRNAFDQTALHVFAHSHENIVDCLKLLLTKEVDVNARTQARQTALHVARCAECVRLLLNAGADIEALDKHRESALFGAIHRQRVVGSWS